ncbi:MAG TPA: glycosyltransferase, partial [Nitratifractor sp.]|nr:glycosyltransferase [Nitratifractor sp.]
YGEENDWCQRAIENGYQNILVPNLFVYHKHGGSFPSELKQKLLEENYQKLLQKHPTYDKQVHDYIAKDSHKELRKLLIITASSSSSPLWVMFDHAIGGGANHYADEVLERQKRANRNTLKIAYDYYTNEYKCNYHYKEYQFEFIMSAMADIEEFLNLCEIEELFLNSLVSYPEQKELLETFDRLSQREYLSLTIPIHDFFALCPSYNLLNQDGNYCGVPDAQTCAVCMQQSKQEWRNFFNDDVDILSWRELWSKLLTRAQTILCFSNSSKEIVQKAYPQIEESKFSVVPHSVSGIEKLTMPEKKSGEPFVIGVLGGINYAKGASVVKELVGLIERQNLNMKVVVIGEITEQIRGKHFQVTGRYKKSKLPALIRQYKVDAFVIPSIWPETFSYTSQEVMNMDLPLVVFDIGAPAERVKGYEKGYIVKGVNAQALLETIERELVEKR